MGNVTEEYDAAFRKKLEKLLPVQTMIARVISLDRNTFTCDVKPVDDSPEFHNVRLQAIIDDNDQGVVVVPKLKSSVLVSIVENNEDNNYISQYSEIDEFIYKIDQFEFSGNAQGVRINNQGEKLKTVLNDLIDNLSFQNQLIQEVNKKLQKVIVINGRSPDVPGLISINDELAKVMDKNTSVKQRLNQILKE
ncbi:hypothetical protein [Tenacibaculum maritimum]|uniref:hypothetical protein n=1 Tax=Tenacibaculum maritimum TaxID=107401 RepID=UPI00042084E4|nr:hypothetical protein [Tenacibaculum maritimum]CAA0260602.1 conserved hypothetical protein [Tenacibaculum maritimum]